MNYGKRDEEAWERDKLMEKGNVLNSRSREFYNGRTRKIQTDDQVVYLFNYARDLSSDSEEVITWRELRDLKDKRQWNVIRHPMVLNFVNEKLLERAYFYVAHISSYLIFLLLLSSYIFDKRALQDILSTLFLIVFGFCLVVKGAIKLQAGNVSKWFIMSYLFNIVTYIATFLFIWTPQLFAYNDYNRDLKHFITWFLPIIAIISAWINFLYILRKSPYGIYILMMTRILYSFSQIAIIWIPTLLAFAFAFHLVMRNSGTEPWEATEVFTPNATVARKFLAILQAITKTSTMMIGEVDADNVLERKEWIPNLLLLAFEVTTVILLMNLMISLAVGDVNELRHSAQDKLLQIKVNFAIEVLQLSESCDCIPNIALPHRKPTNNVLVIDSEGQSFSTMKRIDFGESAKENPPLHVSHVTVEGSSYGGRVINLRPETNLLRQCLHPTSSSRSASEQPFGLHQIPTMEQSYASSNATTFFSAPPSIHSLVPKVYHLHFPTGDRGVRLQKRPASGRAVQVTMSEAMLQLVESADSGIETFEGKIDGVKTCEVGDDPEGIARKFARWIIGLDWSTLVDF